MPLASAADELLELVSSPPRRTTRSPGVKFVIGVSARAVTLPQAKNANTNTSEANLRMLMNLILKT